MLAFETTRDISARRPSWPEEVSYPGNPECSCECLCIALGAVASGEIGSSPRREARVAGQRCVFVALVVSGLPSAAMHTLVQENGDVSAETIRLCEEDGCNSGAWQRAR